MALSPTVPCPSCASPVSLRLAWDMTPKNRFGFLEHSTGVACPSCKVRLRIVERNAVLVAIALALSGFAVAAIAGPYRATTAGAVLLAIVVLLLGLAMFPGAYASRFLTLKVRGGNDLVDFPVERLKEELALVEREDDAPSASMLKAAASFWVCHKCGEPNPVASGLCHACGQYSANAI